MTKNSMSLNFLNLNKYEKVILILTLTFFTLFTSHVDIWETANHSYLFLESIFNGNIFNYYGYVQTHANDLYYINNANYNILIYLVFGIWQLPIFIINNLFSLPINEPVLWLWSKVLSVLFFIGSAYLIKQICLLLNLEEKTASVCALAFLLNPIAFYSPVIMGQYDTLCLFFLLLSLCYYIKGDMKKFAFVMGISVVFKFFSFLIFIPLLLLKNKKILHLLKYAVISLWLYIPTSLLYMGKTGNASLFVSLMFERMFANTMDFGFGKVSIFVLTYFLICVFSFLYNSENTNINYITFYISTVIFATLFFNIYWHPQWLVLLMPFILITTFMQKNKRIWLYMEIFFSLGFFILCFYNFPQQVGAVMFDGGLYSFLANTRLAVDAKNLVNVNHFLNLIPYCFYTATIAFSGAIFSNIIFKFPIKNTSIADFISDETQYDAIPYKLIIYVVFAVGLLGFWFMPSLLEMLNAYNIF